MRVGALGVLTAGSGALTLGAGAGDFEDGEGDGAEPVPVDGDFDGEEVGAFAEALAARTFGEALLLTACDDAAN